MSDALYMSFLNGTKQKVTATTFLVDGLDEIKHFGDSDEILDWVTPYMTYDYFSRNFMKISAAQTVCTNCFKEYLIKHDIGLEETYVKVIG